MSLLIILSAATLALIIAGLNLQRTKVAAGDAKLIITSIGIKSEEAYLIDKATALDLVSRKHNVSLGNSFIECIDNLCEDSGYWWKLYVNGKESIEGAGFYIVNGGDEIEFRFTKK